MKSFIHERALRITYKDDTPTCQELLHKENSASFCFFLFFFNLNLLQYITRVCKFWRQQGILYVDGWCASFKIIYIFFKTLMTLL